jgi:hypothetical protein
VSHVLDHDQTKHSPALHRAAPAATPKR